MKSFLNSFLKQFACLAFACGLVGAASAETTIYNGQTIEFTGATVSPDSSGNPVFTFATPGSGYTLKIPAIATMDILVVGGGGGGGGGYRRGGTTSYGHGGNGGGVDEVPDRPVEAQVLRVVVGGGGNGGTDANGGKGGDSSVTGTVDFEPVTGIGGTGGLGHQGSSQAGAGSGTSSQITGNSYGKGGAANTSTSNPTPGADNTGNGGQAAKTASNNKESTTGAAGGSGIVVVRITSLKPSFDCGIRAIGATESFTIPHDERWGDSWTVTSSDTTKATATPSGDAVTVTGVAEGQATVTVENDDGIYNYTVYVSQVPHRVRFCEGDQVQIWYADPTSGSSGWFLLINNNRYELGKTGSGAQMDVTLSVMGGGDDRTYIIGTAVKPGTAENADLVIISDGSRFYGYRMSVDAPREVAIGGEVEMECATVAENVWSTEVDDEYREFISADCTQKDVPAHRTTATITGLALTDEAYVRVRDDKWKEGEHNAQGAVYTLKVAVTGVPTIPVNMSPGVTMPVGWGFKDGTAETVYTVVVSNAQTGVEATAPVKSADGKSFTLELSAAATANTGAESAFFTVCADGEPVVTYKVTSSPMFVFPMMVGQVAEGFLTGVKKTPWVTSSSNPDVVSVKPVLYRELHSGEARALAAGDATFISTNAYWQAGYFGVRAMVADTHVTSLSMPTNALTNVVISLGSGFAGMWTVENLYDDLLTVTLPEGSGSSAELEVTLASGNVSGPVTFKVSNGYHVETFNVFIDNEDSATKSKVMVPGHLQVVVDGVLTLPTNCVTSAWTAQSVNAAIADVVASGGAAGTAVEVRGVSASSTTLDGRPTSGTLVMVENETTIYVYQVDVIKPSEVMTDTGTVNIGATIEMNATMFSNIVSVTSMNPLIASATYDPSAHKVRVTGIQEGKTQLKVTTAEKVYYININVRNAHIDKHVELLLGDNGTVVPYSFTFDGIISVESHSNALRVDKNGNTLTFVPLAEELNETNAQVRVKCFVDKLSAESELHYWFTVKRIPTGETLWRDGSQEGFIYGYLSYSGEALAIDRGTDLILVYTNVNDIGRITIPSPFSAQVDILAVGGGGAGGTAAGIGGAGGGGGAGGYEFVTNRVFESGVIAIDVGAGGKVVDNLLVGGGVQGASGRPSIVSNVFGYAFASAAGGGGGGGPGSSTTIDGLPGGSGGGATYRGSVAGAAGKNVEGEGLPGGKPTDTTAAAGGGGAGGLGGAVQTGGAGVDNDITGESVHYAQGGNGGVTYRVERGADGAGPGFGGDGGSAAAGGAGADGVIIVHIKDVYKNIKVPVPGTNDIAGVEAGTLLQAGLVTPRFVWTNGQTYVAFKYEGQEFRSSTDAHPRLYSDVFESVTGVISTNCYETGAVDAEGNPVLGGVGYYNFTVRLKPGYSWEDGLGQGTSGSTSAKMFRWVVVADESVIDAAIDIHKTVSWADSSNATVAVTTYTSPETSGGGIPNVLFIGSACNAHSMEETTIYDSITTAAKAGIVDYYVFDILGNPPHTGHLEQGETLTSIPGLNWTYTQHAHLNAFYNTFYDILSNPETRGKYDYIIMEFDGSRLGALVRGVEYTANAHEAEVAAWLKPYYDNENIILVVDRLGDSTANEIWGNNDGYWRPNTYYYSSGDQTLGFASFKGLLGLTAPDVYLANASARSFSELDLTSGIVTRSGHYAGPRYDVQANYKEVDVLYDLIENTIKVKPYNLALRDKIVNPDKGLTLTGVTIQVNTNGTGKTATSASEDWADLITWNTDGSTVFTPAKGINGASIEVDMTSNVVRSVISNVDFQVWTRVNIHVVDDGKFRTTEDAIYNQQTGKWEKNPNEGKAFAEMVNGLGIAMNIDGEAETDTPWDFPTRTVSGDAVYGEVFVGGVRQDSQGYGVGSTVTVYYRGLPGYRLKSVTVDGKPVDINAFPTSYTFETIADDHKIHVEYESFVGEIVSSPVTNVYDGAMHFYDVTLKDWPADVSNEVRYATEEMKDVANAYTNAEAFSELYGTNSPAYNPDELTDVGEHRFYYRVYVLQPGYGENFEPGWVWVDVGEGADVSVITPAPLQVRPDGSDKIEANEALPDIGYAFKGFIAGEDASVLEEGATNGWKVISVYNVGDGAGLYETWVATNAPAGTSAGYALDQYRIAAGDPDCLDPSENPANSGNYYFVPADNFQPVELIPLEIGGVRQGPRLDPEDPLMDTGVKPAEKVYDGVATNITVTVTSKTVGGDGHTLVEGTDYTITYQLAPSSDPTHPTGDVYEENPTFTHAGTNVVWYFVEPLNDQTNIFFAASNYQYVVITPRPLELESLSKTWVYDGDEHSNNVIRLNSGSLVNGDRLTTNTTATITHVAESVKPNVFDWNIVSGDKNFTGDPKSDYIVTTIVGELAITPKPITIGGVTYPDDPALIQPYKDPETGEILAGVEGAERTYDGVPTNIVVRVDDPGEGEYTVYYTTNYCGAATEWTTEPYLFTNVTETTVFYRVVPTGANPDDYVPATGYAPVVVRPAPLYVKPADAGQIAPGDELPDIGIVYEGLVGDDTLADVFSADDTNGWHVVSTYDPETSGAGTYTNIVVTDAGTPVGAGDPTLTDPSRGEWNFGNYYLVPCTNDILVARVCAYSNIHGLLKIETAYTNTIIPAPWSDYSRDGSPTNDIRVDRMVKPRNLTDGDLLMQYANGGVYKAWILEKDEGEEGVWTPMNTVKQSSLVGGGTNVIESLDAIYVKPDGNETQKRGYGLWLVRRNPLDAQGNPRPFYLYGQWLTGAETVTIGGTDADDVAVHYPGAHYGVVHDTMLANPDCTGGTDINGYPWTDADGADTIIINNDTSMHTYCSRLQKSKRQGGGWFEGWWQYGLSGYTQDGIATPAGVGFWYERRVAGPMTHTWTADAPKYAGDGQDHDVWIVDHADAGDGKTHLAFKLGGRLAPGTVTRDFIRQLFDSGSIRYLHATGATQAEGKAMLDSLTAALPEGARPVLALRNGTGVNTEEELAKGWIWVTVDVTDGTNAADGDTDGTGDTNGAGDLWRIVIGRGVWSEP